MTMTNKVVNAYKRSDKRRNTVDLSVVAAALDKLSKIRKRPEGYTLEVVRQVKDSIVNDTLHPLKNSVLGILNNVNPDAVKNTRKGDGSDLSGEKVVDMNKEWDNAFKIKHGRKPNFCDSEYRTAWCEKQKSQESFVASNATLTG